MGHCRSQVGQFSQTDPALAGFLTDIHLQADIQWSQSLGALLAESLGDLKTVDTVHPIEIRGDGGGLVRLDRPDEMPDQIGNIRQFRLFGQGFLKIVFTKMALSRRHGLCYGGRRLGLTDCDEMDRLRGAACLAFSQGDAGPHGVKSFRKGE